MIIDNEQTTAAAQPARKCGRPEKLTPEVRGQFIKLIAVGLSYKRACALLRFSFQCLQEYRQRHPDFQGEIDAAVAASIARSLRRIERAADGGDVSCDRWLLERRFPEEYGRNRVELTGANGQPLHGTVQIMLPPKDPPPAPLLANTGPEQLTNGTNEPETNDETNEN